jgi:predicted nucleic acid-binding Zn ribbon protein
MIILFSQLSNALAASGYDNWKDWLDKNGYNSSAVSSYAAAQSELAEQVNAINSAEDVKQKIDLENRQKQYEMNIIMIISLISILSIAVIVLIILKRKGVIFKKPMNIKKLAKAFSIIFFIAFSAILIYTTVLHVPKYAEYRDGNTKERIGTGYYNIADFYRVYYLPTNISNGHANSGVDLQIDYGQWGMTVFLDCAVLLLPSIVLFKISKTKTPN